MALSRTQLAKIAELARLKLSESEAASLSRDCANILDYFEQVSGVDIEKLQPGETADRTAPLREDVVDPDPLQRQVAELAPAWREGFFVIPRLPALDADSLDEAGGP